MYTPTVLSYFGMSFARLALSSCWSAAISYKINERNYSQAQQLAAMNVGLYNLKL